MGDLDLVLRARRPAVHLIGPVVIRAVDALGARFAEAAVGAEVAVRVDPRRLALRTPVIPRAAAAVTGTHTAAAAGEGLEYADVRTQAGFLAAELPRQLAGGPAALDRGLRVGAIALAGSLVGVLVLSSGVTAPDAVLDVAAVTAVLALAGGLAWALRRRN